MTDPTPLVDELERCLSEQKQLISSGDFDRLEQMHTKIMTLLETITRQAKQLDAQTLQRLHDIEKLHRDAMLLGASIQQENKEQLARIAPGKRQLRAYRM